MENLPEWRSSNQVVAEQMQTPTVPWPHSRRGVWSVADVEFEKSRYWWL